MGNHQKIFKRHEKKYLMSESQYQLLMRFLDNCVQMNEFGKSSICNLYLDTPDFQLIRQSIDKPVYKEKLRLRSYGVPDANGTVFLELKKKFKKVVYKRRISMSLSEANQFIETKRMPPNAGQIERELCWAMNYYKQLAPRMYISYDRLAYQGIEDPELRITFDRNIRWRIKSLDLAQGIFGAPLLREDQYLMEIKAVGAFPMWLTEDLDCLGIYPTSFSKYGRAYKQLLARSLDGKRQQQKIVQPPQESKGDWLYA